MVQVSRIKTHMRETCTKNLKLHTQPSKFLLRETWRMTKMTINELAVAATVVLSAVNDKVKQQRKHTISIT